MTCNNGSFHLHSRYIVQILVNSHFELISSILALDSTEPVSQPVTIMAVEMTNIHLILLQQKHSSHFSTAKEISVKATFFFMQQPQQTKWNPSELVKCKWWTDKSLYSRMEVVDEMEYQKL